MSKQIKLLIGGPSNSGKSTFALSLVARLKRQGIAAESVELDVWSNSYPAFRGDVPFERREKRYGLDWDWQSPLAERLAIFNRSTATVTFGDLAGVLDEAVCFVCARAKADGALVVSRGLDGIHSWREAFRSHDLPVVAECLTALRLQRPFLVSEMNRTIQPDNHGVRLFSQHLLELLSDKLR